MQSRAMQILYKKLPHRWAWKLYNARLRWRYALGICDVDDAWAIEQQMKAKVNKYWADIEAELSEEVSCDNMSQ